MRNKKIINISLVLIMIFSMVGCDLDRKELSNKNLVNIESTFTFGNEYLDQAVREYLQTQPEFSWQTEVGSKNICVFDKLDKEDLFPHYLWVRCGEFLVRNGQVEELSGSSLPAKIDYPNELSFFDLEKFTHLIPGDGSFYAEDIKKIFPIELQSGILRYDATKINKKIKGMAREEFDINKK